jgi:putative ATP-dependent endonuclease of OLD family
LLWAALKILSEEKSTSARPHVLLIDEPELCLHPNAVRDACKVLYDLAEKSGWQVMLTTHSPVFIDLARDNTSIIRVARTADTINSISLFRPKVAALSQDDKENLKLLNTYDPYVAEFFFGGRVVVVEGDTEYSAFKYVCNQFPAEFQDVHVVRARGKAIQHLKGDATKLATVKMLLQALLDHTKPLPEGAHAWSEMKVLEDTLNALTKQSKEIVA